MQYENEVVMRAFRLYAELARSGMVEREGLQQYLADDEVRDSLISSRERSTA